MTYTELRRFLTIEESRQEHEMSEKLCCSSDKEIAEAQKWYAMMFPIAEKRSKLPNWGVHHSKPIGVPNE